MQCCLKCGRVFPNKFRGEPAPGGVMRCLKCNHAMIFNDDMTLREPTAEEVTEISQVRSLQILPFPPLTIMLGLLAVAGIKLWIFGS